MAEVLEENVRGLSRRRSENLAEEYRNLYTVCWASIYDEEFLWDKFQIKGEFLRSELQDEGLYVSYFGNKVDFPDRAPSWKVDIPLESYGRYDCHQENMDEWLEDG